MNLHVALWTFGMSIGGIVLGDTAGAPYGAVAIVIGAFAGAAVGFALGTLFARMSNSKHA
jgi:hypothetical protein